MRAVAPRTGTSMAINGGVARVLARLDDWRTPEQLAQESRDLTPRQLARMLGVLAKAGIVERAPGGRMASPPADPVWKEWGEAAALFHFSTRRERYAVEAERVESALSVKAAMTPPPSPVQRRRGPQSRLPAVDRSSTLAATLGERRTWRRFGKAQMRVQQLADLLGMTFGVQQWAETRGQGRVALKTSPSGGACHPIEAFVLVRRVSGLRGGFYHYESDRHRLTKVAPANGAPTMRRCLQAQPWLADASVLVFLCPIFGRTAWRYPTARAYRSVLIEAGHLGQTFCLLAAERGLAPFCTLAVDDVEIDRRLGLDGITQGVVYAVGCGTAPRTGYVSGVPLKEFSAHE